MKVEDCEKCGYRPRRKDAHDIDGVGIHVICYKCNHEWVE